uniref:3-oxoacyl-[acyl-carrier protein] reductase n=1 Tax=Kwoniella dejecticola CBS 10117 TaxID=1296121 RepID=A0A1A6A593_9TREE|nr:uncharacterized protein I303_04554 [Kwoniella dejecticola CBS 10117]OBR85221.1 hypothetical protein I303_04554 [Kwoniella dejecticola CBS 10117]
MISATTPVKKVAIVTGSAQGIGRAIAFRLAEDGYNICLVDLPSSSKLLEEVTQEITSKGHSTSVVAVHVDVSIEKEVYAMVDKTVQTLGRVDVMVANAGIAPVTPFLELSTDTLDKVYQVNVRGVFLCYQAAAKQMIQQGEGGRLIGEYKDRTPPLPSPLPPHPIASASPPTSKFAVRAINQGAAVELGKYGITANVYCPTVVETEMWAKIDDEISSLKGTQKGEYTEKVSGLYQV